MAGTVIDYPLNGASNWEDFTSIVQKLQAGHESIDFDELDTTNDSELQNGSIFDVNGQIAVFSSDEAASGFAGISNDTECWIKAVVSGASVTLEYTNMVPTYSATKRGWYDGNDRYLLALYKDGSGNPTKKHVIGRPFFDVLTSGSAASWFAPWDGMYKVTVVGGGGGGGDCNFATKYAPGGGGGGAAIKWYRLIAGQTCTYTIGAGGAHSANGSSTTFTDGVTAITGTGGTAGGDPPSGTVAANPGVGGAGSNGDLNVDGGDGHTAGGTYLGSSTIGAGGGGGNSILGGGGRSYGATSTTDAKNGDAGGAYGGGGGGAMRANSGTAVDGGAGAAGVIVIEYVGSERKAA